MSDLYEMDPKLLKKASPRPPVKPAIGVVGTSLLSFEGTDMLYGKVSAIAHGYFETFKQLLYVGAALDTMRHPTLGRVYTVLEGSGFLIRNSERFVLTQGVTAVAGPKDEYYFETDREYLLLSVAQECYYGLELEVVRETVRSGLQPLTPYAKLKRHQSKAKEQLQAMANPASPIQDTPATPTCLTEDFDPLDPLVNGVNAKPPKL